MAVKNNGASISISRDAIEAMSEYCAQLCKTLETIKDDVKSQIDYLSNEDNIDGGQEVSELRVNLKNIEMTLQTVYDKVCKANAACIKIREKYGITSAEAAKTLEYAKTLMYQAVKKIQEQGA